MAGPKNAVGVFTRGDGVTIYVIPKQGEDANDAVKRVAGNHGHDSSQVQRIEGNYNLERQSSAPVEEEIIEEEPSTI